ncbi:hypothetical protein Desde_3988 [Desulfitobacterium dehalogenans ATCC 51507]|uniref:Uncharacterized protein n=1 Tax=Desulfitobacterium dehalogenans (strain ATCC 51507 / DSM 9161 / JW/IU-DC1) TaxID=756499 RepID=I4AE66_DESDJ|nr:hypothetical protein [Desulfitobacterium dehalogenans]AFM02251.1 hypothetical protein Desde_3988 [Desulfitobacterium dehalogenans ATCC 51507]
MDIQDKINFVHNLEKLYKNLNDLTLEDYKDLIDLPEIKEILESEEMKLLIVEKSKTKSKKKHMPFEEFRFDYIMNRLRNTVLNRSCEKDSASDIDWLLKILLVSPELFPTVKELDNFLINMTGKRHNTRSTGRDRIVDWYFKAIAEMDIEEQNKVFYKIAKYIFINIPSNYKEWHKVLSKEGKKI